MPVNETVEAPQTALQSEEESTVGGPSKSNEQRALGSIHPSKRLTYSPGPKFGRDCVHSPKVPRDADTFCYSFMENDFSSLPDTLC